MLSYGVGRKTANYTTISRSGISIAARLLVATSLTGTLLTPMVAFAQSQLEPTTQMAQAVIDASALGDRRFQFDIGAQALSGALMAYSRTSGIDVVFDGSLPEGVMSTALSAEMTAASALNLILSGSGLSWIAVNATTVSIILSDEMSEQETVTVPVTVTSSQRDVGYNGAPDWVYNTPGSTTVIGREEINRVSARRAGDIFEQVTGVESYGNEQIPGLAVNVRGQQDHGRVNMNIDGARQNYNQSGHGVTSYAYVDTALLAEVTVEKTDLSGVGGTGASAGIVTMRTLDTDDILDPDETWGGKVNVSRGTNRYEFVGDTSVGARFTPKFDMAAAISRKVIGDYIGGTNNPELYEKAADGAVKLADDGNEAYTYQRQTSGLIKANMKFNEDFETKLGYVGFTGSFAKASDEDSTYNDYNDVETHTLTVKNNWNPSSELIDAKANLWWNRTENNQYRPPRSTTKAYETMYRMDSIGLDASNSSMFFPEGKSLENTTVTLDYGVEGFRDKAKTQSETFGNEANGSSYELEGSTPSGRRDVYGAFSKGTFNWNDIFEISGGLRYDRYHVYGDSYYCELNTSGSINTCKTGGTPLSIDLEDQKLAPSAKLAVMPIDGLQLYGTYRESMRAPSIMESLIKGSHVAGIGIPFYANPNLQAEDSTTTEIGANFSFDDVAIQGDRFRAKLARYHTSIDDYVVMGQVFQPTKNCTIPSIPATCSLRTAQAFVNLTDPVTIDGTEMELSYDAQTFFVGGSIAIADTDLIGAYNPRIYPTDDANSTSALGTVANLQAVYTLPKRKYTLNGGVRLFDQKLLLGANATFVYPDKNISQFTSGTTDIGTFYRYRTYDVYGSYDVNSNVRLGVSVNNLTDEAYMTAGYVPAPGRTVIFSMSGNF